MTRDIRETTARIAALIAVALPGGSAAQIADTPAEAEGRRTLSTAFVRIGPDGWLTVTLGDGRLVQLRDVTMQPRQYCGTRAGGRGWCGGYAEVAAARPGRHA